jgi:nucleotide-binding universal stress UspA family protein
MGFIRSILVPHDFSEYADSALAWALDLDEFMKADLHLLHVVQPPSYLFGADLYAYAAGSLHHPTDEFIAIHQSAKEQLTRISDRIEMHRARIRTHVVDGIRISDAITRQAESLEADLIVMGTHGLTGLAHLLLGSVAETTLREAPCPVVTVRRTLERISASRSDDERKADQFQLGSIKHGPRTSPAV